MTLTALPMLDSCPKLMAIGPCGGVSADHSCEIRPEAACPFTGGTPEISPQVQATAEREIAAATRPQGRLAELFDSGTFAVIAEVNGVDSADATEFTSAAQRIQSVADIVSITDHSGANVHMGNVAAIAHMIGGGVTAMPTFTCRDRNRIALQGDLLGAASLGAESVLLVTGNHVEVGDSPHAKPVFDLDSTRLIRVAADLRDQGLLENGRAVEQAPQFLIGAAAHPFAPPYERRPAHVLRKVEAGADFLITQHIFDLPRWRDFVGDLNALRADTRPFHLLGGVAILPDEQTARTVNAGLRGFTIPEEVLLRLRQAKDPAAEGITIAAETIAELDATEGVAGTLLAPVTLRTNALTASVEQAEILAAVLKEAGVR